MLADRRTISKRDVVEADQVLTTKVRENAYAYHRLGQKWCWLSDQNPEEITMFLTWAPGTEAAYAGLY